MHYKVTHSPPHPKVMQLKRKIKTSTDRILNAVLQVSYIIWNSRFALNLMVLGNLGTLLLISILNAGKLDIMF